MALANAASAAYSITTEYDSSATYAVGDYCWYGDAGRIYLCRYTTAITTPESWNSAHWEPVTVGDELSNIKSQELVKPQTDGLSGQVLTSDGEGNQSWQFLASLNFHICSPSEYNATTHVPTVTNPDEHIFYITPGTDSLNLYHNVGGQWMILFQTSSLSNKAILG